MSLDFMLMEGDEQVFSANITHNLTKMANTAGIYYALWRPEEISCTQAKHIIPILSAGLIELITNRTKYEQFNSPNGWGMYAHFVPFVTEVLTACSDNPESTIRISR